MNFKTIAFQHYFFVSFFSLNGVSYNTMLYRTKLYLLQYPHRHVLPDFDEAFYVPCILRQRFECTGSIVWPGKKTNRMCRG